jgi:hypothetical protein
VAPRVAVDREGGGEEEATTWQGWRVEIDRTDVTNHAA